MTRIHAEIVIAAALLLLVLLWVLWRSDATARVQNAGRILLAVMVAQGLIGYAQFFSHLPPVLVGIHVLGASVVWCTVLWFHHGLSDHLPESSGVPRPATGPEARRSEGPTVASQSADEPLREPV